MKKYLVGIALLATMFLIGIFTNLVVRHVLTTKHVKELISSGYYPLEDVMMTDGFCKGEDNVFLKKIGEKEEKITFDFKKKKCMKNEYKFALKSSFLVFEEKYFVSKEKLEEIINYEIKYEDGEIILNNIPYKQWYEISDMVAHAGGAVREDKFNSLYTNSREALIENYNRGCRVFEFDFSFTSDNLLAAVHDWDNFGNQDGKAMSSSEWKEFQTFGKPMTDGRYETMMLEDILDEMMINKDMILITDSKSFELTDEEILFQFKLIYDECMKRDEALIDRVVPQIYNEKMYETIMQVYSWKSIVFTAYRTDEEPSEIVEFAAKHDAIKVITAPKSNDKFEKSIINKIHEKGLLIYNHTTDSFNTLVHLKMRDIDGVYTNLLY